VEIARESLESKKALSVFKKFVEFNSWQLYDEHSWRNM
jgi:hypothetical protein